MNSMKRKMLLGTSLLLPLVLSSCGGAAKRDALIFYVWGSTQEVSYYEKIASDFTKESGVKVKVQPATGDYYDGLNISFSSKRNAPDLFFTESGEFNGHMASRKLLNLTPYIESGALDIKTTQNPDGKIELWDVNKTYTSKNGKLGDGGDYYALIKDWSPDFVLWYNKDHIDAYNEENGFVKGDQEFMEYPDSKIPMSWAEFEDMSYKLTKPGRYGTMLDRVPYKHVFEWIQMTGSSVWKDEGKYFNSEDPNVIKAFKLFTDLQVGEKASAPKNGSTAASSGNLFANGNVSLTFFGNWAYSNYDWANVSFDWGIAPPPTPEKGVSEEDTYCASAGLISLAIYKDTTLKDEAISFLNYYMTKGQHYMASKGFNIPGNKITANSDEFLHPEDSDLARINQYFARIANKYSHTLEYNQYIPQLTVESKIDKYLSNYLNDPKSTTIEEVLKNIETDLRKEIR